MTEIPKATSQNVAFEYLIVSEQPAGADAFDQDERYNLYSKYSTTWEESVTSPNSSSATAHQESKERESQHGLAKQ